MTRWTRRWRHFQAEETGAAVLVTMGAGLVVMLSVAALVIDLGSLRAVRSRAWVATDAASSAAALTLAASHPRGACSVAVGFAEANLPGDPLFLGADCSTFPTSCDDTTPEYTTTDTWGDWTLTVTIPVDDGSPLMSPAAMGGPSQALSSDDGDRCERAGVSLSNSHSLVFASILGVSSSTTEVHSVARGRWVQPDTLSVNLVILHRYNCDVLVAEGSGSQEGGVQLEAVFNPNTGKLVPGTAVVDSDATGSGCGMDGTIDIDGSKTLIRADGPPGCDDQIGTHIGQGGLTVGEGCGQIRTLAPGTPGCYLPACSSTGLILPDPQVLEGRVTRAPMDHFFNCKESYPFPAGWEIEGCESAALPLIDTLIAAYGTVGDTPPGFQTWTGMGYGCSVEGPPGPPITVSGDTRVDCPTFAVKRGVNFQTGSVIFDGDVAITGNGEMSINTASGGAGTSATDPAVVYLRDGELSKAGGSDLYVANALLYVSATSTVTASGGSGVLSWTAPDSGDFLNLALWSDSATVHELSGQSFLALEGVFFAPLARIDYRGNGATHQVQAQFIALELRVLGNGRLVIEPVWDRLIQFPCCAIQQLLR